MPPLLSINNLCVEFSNEGIRNTAVDQLTLDIAAGETLAIVGESGSGKSVTALSILQLLPDSSRYEGEIFFQANEETRINLLTADAKKMNGIRGNRIAMIFQEPMTSLNPLHTCGQQVAEAIMLHQEADRRTARQKTIELFIAVELPDPEGILKKYPHQLSGGQKQRVMIAMAMSCNPALLIADEPTTALDVTVQQTILQLIKKLQVQNKMSVILITHDLGIVADIADSIAVMYKGKLVEQGKAAAVLHHPQHPYTKALLACRPAGKPKGQRLPVVSDFMNEQAAAVPSAAEKNIAVITNETVLEVKHLVVSFPARKNFFGATTAFFNAVDDVSFSVKKGETLGLVGESGCGKTTLGRAILQLIKPTGGQIILNGEDMTRIKAADMRARRKDLQIVFQDPYGSLDPRITIGEAILEPLKIHGMPETNMQRKERVMSLLEKVSLPADYYQRYPHQLSGGQRQRICIARALATMPSFLVFDESVSALDVSVQAQVLNLLNDLKKEFGFTAIFISHDLSVVHYACNRILVMNKGKIVEAGDAEQVYQRPVSAYTQRLIAAIPGKGLNYSP